MPTAPRPEVKSPNDLLPARQARPNEVGVSLVGLLVTLAIVGAMAAAIPLLARGSTPNAASPGVSISTGRGPASGAVAAAGNDISAAEVAACRASYEAAEAAVSAYQAQTGSLPTSISQLKAFIRDSLSSPFFNITIDPLRPGQLQVTTRDHVAADGDANCSALGT
jgi:2-methylcitrate dehydratase PrpD